MESCSGRVSCNTIKHSSMHFIIWYRIMSCATIMIIIKLTKACHHVAIHICLDDALKYTFHLALASPIKISISSMTCSHIIELKLEIKLLDSLHLNRLLNFLRYSRRMSCISHPKLVTSQHSGRRQSRIVVRSCAVTMLACWPPSLGPTTQHLSASCCISLAFVSQLWIGSKNKT